MAARRQREVCTGREIGRSRMKTRKKEDERETGRQRERNGAKRDRDIQRWGEA